MHLRHHLVAICAALAAIAAALIVSQPEAVWAAPAAATSGTSIVDTNPAGGPTSGSSL